MENEIKNEALEEAKEEVKEEAKEETKENSTENFIRFKSENDSFDREEWILSRLREEDIMEYLRMEEKKSELLLEMKKVREERIFFAFQILMLLFAVIFIVYFLKDSPTVLVNILYITGIIAVLWILKKKEKNEK